MLKVTLTNTRTNETLDLDEISMNGTGVQAIAGMTGLGLPPVDVQWFEGAGDGAKYRNTRVQPRDIDVPLYVYAANRAALKTKIAAIARVMSGPMTLKLIESDGTYVWSEVVRVGGGTITYGVDTTGETDWESIVTLRAGNPYWLAQNTSSLSRTYVAVDTYTATNSGTADTYPTWTVHGPLTYFKIANNDTGERLEWSGTLNVGDTLTVDTEAGTVVDQAGNNRYGGMGSAPDLFRLRPGGNSLTVTLTKLTSGVRTNYATNPSYNGTTIDFTADSVRPEMTAIPLAISSGSLHVGGGSLTYPYTTQRSATRSWVLPSGEAGKTMSLTVSGTHDGGTHRTPKLTLTVSTGGQPDWYQVGWTQGSAPGSFDISREFVVPANRTVSLQVTEGLDVSGTSYPSRQVHINNLYLGYSGAYFDGSTADTADVRYDWTGAVDNSTSTATQLLTPSPDCSLTFRQRDWMVV